MESKTTCIIILPASIKTLTECSWEFSYRTLWHKFELTDEDIELIKRLISDYYGMIPPDEFHEKANDYFNEFCRKISEAENKACYLFNKPYLLIDKVCCMAS